MKQLLLFTSLLLLTFSTITAQDSNEKETKKTTFGILIGKELFDFKPRESYSIDSGVITNYSFGLFLNRALSEKFNLQLETSFLKSIQNENQLETSLLLNYRINTKVELYAGGQFYYRLKEHAIYSNTNYGFNLGTRYNFNKNWFADLRYVHRFPSNTKSNFVVSNQDNIRSVRLGIGYRF